MFDIGGAVSLLEAKLLIASLLRDTDSKLQAAVNDWDYPVSREWILLAHLYDLTAMINSKNKPKPYPTPYPIDGATRIGRKSQSRNVVLDRLNAMNPKDKNG